MYHIRMICTDSWEILFIITSWFKLKKNLPHTVHLTCKINQTFIRSYKTIRETRGFTLNMTLLDLLNVRPKNTWLSLCQKSSYHKHLFRNLNWALQPCDVHAVLPQQRIKSIPTNGLCHLHNSNGTRNLATVVWDGAGKQWAIRPGQGSWATVLQIATTAVTTTGEMTVAKQPPDARP